MKIKILIPIIILGILITGFLISCKYRPTISDTYITYTVEGIDDEINLYRIDVMSKEPIEDWANIDYNLKIKFQTIKLRKTHKDTLINMIREECPENIRSITLQFNSNL